MLQSLRRWFRGAAQASAPAPDGGLPSPRAAWGHPGAAGRHEAGTNGGPEQDLANLVAGVQDHAIFLLDPEGRVESWNQGAERIHGWTAAEVLGRPLASLHPTDGDGGESPEEELRRAAAEGRYEHEGWRLRKDGSRYWADTVITPLRGPLGTARGFLVILRDLTGRLEAEESARRLLEEAAARRAAEASAREAEAARVEERRQREELRVTLASIGDAVIVTDAAGRITFLNPVAAGLTGWTSEQAAGEPLERVFHIVNEETRAVVENPVQRVLREGVVVGLANHTILLARDGREVPIDDSAAPIRAEGEAMTGVVLVFRDVTEARRAMRERLHLAAIVESSDDAIIGQGLDGVIQSWNLGAERLYGYTADEILGRQLSELVPPDQPDELPALLQRIRQGESIDHFETVRLCKDGRRVSVSLTISPIRDADGRIVGASKIARDVTDKKRQEAALRFLAESSQALAESLDIAETLQRVAWMAVPRFADWCTVDMLLPDGSLERLAAAHVDPGKVELLHDMFRRFPPLREDGIGPYRVLLSEAPQLVPEVRPEILDGNLRDEGKRRALRILGFDSYLGVPLAARGRNLGVLSFVTSSSGRRYGHGDLQLARDLAQRAAIALDNARLYAELRETDRRKDEFLAMLAHELRNPLAPIRTSLQVLDTPGASDAMLRHARSVAHRQVQHLVRMVDDLLDVSRIMRGRIELRRELVDLATVIGQALETALPTVEAQDQELVLSLPEEPLRLEVDPTRFAQIVSNLVQNAAKFSDGSGRIWVEAEPDGDEVVLRVRDQGAGISPELLPHIFELFVQGDASLARARGGLGIGLTVVHRLVELHGGTVVARSEGPDKGSEFEVRLPAATGHPRSKSKGPGTSAGATALRSVLVVDDNVDAAESVAMLLRLWGHRVHVAHDGPEALRTAAEHHPDVVVLDIGLPGMNGYEVAERLEPHGTERPVVVALSGYGREEDRRRSREAGISHHLTKPVDPKELRDLLAALPVVGEGPGPGAPGARSRAAAP